MCRVVAYSPFDHSDIGFSQVTRPFAGVSSGASPPCHTTRGVEFDIFPSPGQLEYFYSFGFSCFAFQLKERWFQARAMGKDARMWL